ncbi:MAG TPA: xylosidase, partial [Flavihumibacter sp.]|nr:xylosidase [Flavihumibacter sp.]
MNFVQKILNRFIIIAFLFFSSNTSLLAQSKNAATPVPASNSKALTYCNPLNLDYGYCPIPNFTTWGKHRATADPVIVNFKGDYYLFSTNQWGYWWSSDLSNWNFVPRKFLKPWHQVYDELCAPAVGIIGDTMIVFGS